MLDLLSLTRPTLMMTLTLASVGAQACNWLNIPSAIKPLGRENAPMVYDIARDRLVMFGGRSNFQGNLNYENETWEHDGTQWILRGTIGPVASWYQDGNLGAVYDAARSVTVAVRCLQGGPTETWEWDGTTWTLQLTGNTPPARFGFQMAYDSTRQKTVLFGGEGAPGFFGDTWEFDGTNWTQVSSGGPAPRGEPAMGFDASRGVVVLHGGSGQANYSDTWEWNGTYWLERWNAGGPGHLRGHMMAFDGARQQLVLMGGTSSGPATTWEWGSNVWVNKQTPCPVDLRGSAAYDSQRGRIALWGGYFGSNDELYAYGQASSQANITAYGSGCTGPAGLPTLTAQSLPRFATNLDVELSNVPNGILNIALGWVGFDDSSWGGVALPAPLDALGYPGCTALLAPEIAYALGSTNTGTVSWQLSIPFIPAADGLEFYLQGGVIVLGYNPGGLVFSNALAGTVGL